MKGVLLRKRRAFREGDKEQLKSVQKELKWVIRRGKEEYKRMLESHFEENNMRRVWEGLNLIGRCKKGKNLKIEPCTADYANDLNVFYARFDCHDFHQERSQRLPNIAKEGTGCRGGRTVVGEEEVRVALTKVHPKKAAGPDGVASRALKGCAEQLYSILCYNFNLSLAHCEVSIPWKVSCIIPVHAWRRER